MHDCPHDLTPAFGYRCCYSCLKKRVLRGGQLDAAELDFVGFYEPRPAPRGRWHQPDSVAMFERDDRDELSPEDSATLSALMSIDNVELPPANALKFLG